jgi:hypothetical protein
MYALGQEGLGLYKPGGQGKMCIRARAIISPAAGEMDSA